MLHFFKKNKEKHLSISLSKSRWYDLQFLDVEQNKLKLLILGHFLPLYPPKNLKNQNFEKWKILLEISSFYTCVQKITIIWCTVPEIWSETDNIFCHFGPFFALLPPPPKKSKFWRKKTPADIIILHKFTIKDNHMMYVSWAIEHNRWNFLSFWTIFCIFIPLTTQKTKIFKKWKKCLEILSFYTSVP